jgi:hypothetical protein
MLLNEIEDREKQKKEEDEKRISNIPLISLTHNQK